MYKFHKIFSLSKSHHLKYNNIQEIPTNQPEGVIVEVQHCHQDWELLYHQETYFERYNTYFSQRKMSMFLQSHYFSHNNNSSLIVQKIRDIPKKIRIDTTIFHPIVGHRPTTGRGCPRSQKCSKRNCSRSLVSVRIFGAKEVSKIGGSRRTKYATTHVATPLASVLRKRKTINRGNPFRLLRSAYINIGEP